MITGVVGSICCGTSSFLVAPMIDKYGFRACYLGIMLIQMISVWSIWTVHENEAPYIVMVGLAYFCFGAHPPMFSTTVVK